MTEDAHAGMNQNDSTKSKESGADSTANRSGGRVSRLSLKIAPRLIAFFMVFGLTPAVALFAILWFQGSIIKEAFMTRAEVSSVALSDLIDRNLFERYGDVQAFGLNTAVQDRSNWRAASADNPLIRAMNGYMTGYGIYKLMLLVDPSGRVVAANSVRADGSPLAVDQLYGKDYSDAAWFQKAMKGEFLEGRNGFTGTAVTQPLFDATVSGLYGEDGYVIPFAAPVKDSAGQVIAVWVNFADFGLVEDIVRNTYEGLKANKMSSAEVTILDPQGRIIVDYDPMGQGWTEYGRNPDIIGKFNLAEKGVEAAVSAVNGEGGVIVSRHARKQIDQAAGYAHSRGAYDYPGLGWSALVRIPVEEAFAAWDGLIYPMLTALAIAAAVIAVTGWFIGRSFAKPIQSLTGVMQRLADGDNSVDVTGRERQDELGDMAKTVLVFKTNAIEMERMEAEQAEQAARAEREKRAAMEALADSFESSVKVVVNGVTSASEQMQSVAESVSHGADQTKEQSATVAAASEQATNNVQTVASAAEELSSSISEISRQVAQSSQIATAAVGQADQTNDQVRSLVDAARSVGDVVNLISDIAEQTNLLALNATIEAARAGEAGKGFAVVASEVKSLANQTAKATEEISQQIGSIQSATDAAAQAIEGIGKTVTEINEIGGAIAAAVEEQGSATSEIARNVQEASLGTQQVSSTIVTVNEAASESGRAAGEMLEATTQLSGQAAQLSQEVDKFLERVRAA